VILEIASDTTALTKDGKPLRYIIVKEFVALDPPPYSYIIGLAYRLLPEGAKFNPSAKLTISYDPAWLYAGVAEESLVIAYNDAGRGWVKLKSYVDTETHIVWAEAPHFTEFALLAEARIDGQNGGSPALSPPPTTISWSLVGGLVGAVGVIGVGLAFFLVRRRRILQAAGSSELAEEPYSWPAETSQPWRQESECKTCRGSGWMTIRKSEHETTLIPCRDCVSLPRVLASRASSRVFDGLSACTGFLATIAFKLHTWIQKHSTRDVKDNKPFSAPPAENDNYSNPKSNNKHNRERRANKKSKRKRR